MNATVPAVPAGAVPARAGPLPRLHDREGRRSRRPGQVLADDVARVAAVRDVLGPAGRIRVDANAAWSVPAAVGGADRARPVRAGVRRAAVRDPRRAGRAAPAAGRRGADRRGRERPQGRRPAAGRAGRRRGPGRAQGRADGRAYGRRCGSRPAAGCRWSSPARWTRRSGIAAGVALAAALPELPYACGLGTVGLMATDVTAAPLTARAGGCCRCVRCGPTRRCSPRWLRRPDRRAWWEARLRRCHALLRDRAGSRREPVDRAGPRARRRAGPVRGARGGAGAGVPVGAAGVRAARGRRGRPAAAARPDRRAVGRVPRAGAGEGVRACRPRWSPRPGRPRPTCTPRCWRPRTPGCRCCC